MKSLLLLSTLLGTTSLCAAAEMGSPANSTAQSKLKKPVTVYETADNDGINLGIRADVLYMVYNTPVLTYASDQTIASQIQYDNILSVPGKPAVGCDLALMYTLPNQPGYSFEAGWYHIVAKFSNNQTIASPSGILPAHAVSLTLAAPGTGTVSARLAINFFDLLMKKSFSFGDWISMTPAVGLVGGYMKGESSASFNASSGGFSSSPVVTSATIGYTTKYQGLGMKIGANSAFKIWQGLKLNADFFYNVLYGFSKSQLISSQNQLYLGTANGANLTNRQHHGMAFIDSLIGLSWGTHFKGESLFLDLHAGWRVQYYFDGWKQFEAVTNDSLHPISLTGQGLQAGATFKF